MKVLPYVYRLTHKTTGQFYIGYRAGNKKVSYLDLPTYQSSSKLVKGLGFENFEWMIVAEFFDKDDAYNFEQLTISEEIHNDLCLNKHYVRDNKRHFKRFGPHSEETRSKMKDSHGSMTEEHKRKISEGNKGKTKGRLRGPKSDEFKKHIGDIHRGKTVSDETKEKISKSKSGKPRAPFSEETKAKMRAAWLKRKEENGSLA